MRETSSAPGACAAAGGTAAPAKGADPTAPGATPAGAVGSAPWAGAAVPSAAAPAPGAEVSRIEIQTADPNIRIIWLAPRKSEDPARNQDEHPNPDRN